MPSKRPSVPRRAAAKRRIRRAAPTAKPRAVAHTHEMRPSPRGADRMPPLAPEKLTAAQREAAAEMAAGPRGVIGPFIAALRSPALLTLLQRLGRYLRYDNVLGQRLTELAILVIARQWSQEFEWAVHAPSAAESGLAPRIIDAIAHRRRPRRMAEDEAVVYDFLRELAKKQTVGDRVYARAVVVLGEAGVVDLLGVAGYYTTLAMILNVARPPTPAAAPRLPALPSPKRRSGRRSAKR